jgi:hypothetical protein
MQIVVGLDIAKQIFQIHAAIGPDWGHRTRCNREPVVASQQKPERREPVARVMAAARANL